MNINGLLAIYNRIVIPRIQRDYAQGRQDCRTKEIRSNLLNDLFFKKNISFNMIFGESDEEKNFIPIDGQQRLTLLFLLALYGHKKLDKENIGLDKLLYSTRESSSDFWNYIIQLDWKTLSDSETITDWCKNQNGFQWYWSMDPTVQSMLCVLDDIHIMYIKFPLHYPNIEIVDFDIHDMTQTGLNETLYIKMNSRGKHLNAFEQIKSALDALLTENSKDYDISVFNNYPRDPTDPINRQDWTFAKKWAYCMDRDWSNWFWDPISTSLDGTLLKLILAYTYIFISCRADSNIYAGSLIEKRKEEILPMLKLTSSEILSNNLDITPSISHITVAYSVLDDHHRLVDNPILRRNYFEGLAKLLCNLIYANRDFASSWGDIIDFRNPDLKFENKQLAILASLIFHKCDYYIGKDFDNWMRFCWNMVENTVKDYESFTTFCRNCKNYYSQGSTHIHIWLSSQYAQLPVSKSKQLEEEIYKASLLSSIYQSYKSSIAAIIFIAESHILLKGRLRPLLLDENGDLSHKGFLKRYKNFNAMFYSTGDVINPPSFIRDYIMCADSRNAMSYNYDSEWSIFLTSEIAIKRKFNASEYDSVWPYLFASPLGEKNILQRDSNQVTELHIREQLLTPGLIESVLNNDSWKSCKPRIRWYYGTYFLYPSDKRGDWYYLMLDWYGNSNEEWNRRAVHLLNSLIEKGIVRMNYDKSAPLINRDNISHNFWIGKDLYFFYKNQEYKLCKDYSLSIVSEEVNNSISATGVNSDDDFILILDRLYNEFSS